MSYLTKINSFISKYILPDKRLYFFILISNVITATLIVSGNYTNMPLDNFNDFIFISLHWILVSFAYTIIIYILSLNRWVFITFFPLLNIVSAIAVFFIFQFDISINSAVVESVFNTTIEEASSLNSSSFILYIILIIILSIALSIYRYKNIKVNNYFIHVLFILFGIAITVFINDFRYKTITHRVPFSIYLATKEYYKTKKLIHLDKIDIAQKSHTSIDSLTILLVFGESARADHLSLNGYYRNTCPLLSQKDIISFRNIYSPWTYTNKSIPYIMTRAGVSNLTPMYQERSIVSIYKKCNFKTFWLGNQSYGDTYAPFVTNCDTIIINKPYQTVYNYKKKVDEELLPHVDVLLSEKAPLKLIIIQLIGSHWYYPSHYPTKFEKYKPVIKSKTFSSGDSIKMINSYDNSILYTDFILSELIKKVTNKRSVLFYLSDHGESLGEENKWLHANELEQEKNPALILWFSEKYLDKNKQFKKIALSNSLKYFDTEFLFHSILQASFINTPVIDSTCSIFNKLYKTVAW